MRPRQTLLWMEPEHPFVIARLAGVFLCALPAVRELYQYAGDPRCVPAPRRPARLPLTPPPPPSTRKAVRMGQHVWLLLATIGTELLAIAKWSKGQFPVPLPRAVRIAWAAGAALLVLYPTVQVRVPSARCAASPAHRACSSAFPAYEGTCAVSRGGRGPRRSSAPLRARPSSSLVEACDDARTAMVAAGDDDFMLCSGFDLAGAKKRI